MNWTILAFIVYSKFWSMLSLGGFFGAFHVKCFNLDTQDPTIYHTGTRGYYFGYSLAFHKHKDKRWLIVGAPLGNDTAQGYKPRYGAVYKCDLKSKRRECEVMTSFDALSSGFGQKENEENFKTGQWMGATVRSADKYIMACAPRFAWPGTKRVARYYPIGKCEVVDTDNPGKAWIWEPCRNVPRSNENDWGYCFLGFDADFNSDVDAIIVGASSLQHSRGRLIGTNLFIGGLFLSSFDRTKIGDQMGYAAIFGKLGSDGADVLIGGAPTGDKMKGMVIVYKSTGYLPVSILLPNPADQIGSYFGSSLAVADVNGDGFKDLLVGAPFFSFRADEGAVYIYINTRKDNLDLSRISLHGDSIPHARFGMAIANAGDLNRDGCEDVAVGAPYEGFDNTGAVYIYSGSRNGLSASHTQKLVPSSFGLAGLSISSFGSSLSAGVDIDGNGYPDLAIGSFLSDRVFYLRSKPVVSIEAKIILKYVQINPKLHEQSCVGPDHSNHICLPARICFWVGGKNVPRPVGITYKFAIDEKEPVYKRGFVLDKSKKSFVVSKTVHIDDHGCFNHTIYLDMKPKNVYAPLVFVASYEYQQPIGCTLCPVMKPGFAEAMASYTKNCGADLLCESDLRILVKTSTKEVLVGVTDSLSLDISISNDRENAYLSKVVALYPRRLSVIGVHSKLNANQIWSFTYFNQSHNRLEFDIGNPIEFGQTENYEVKFTIEDIESSVRNLTFDVKAVTSSKDVNSMNNRMLVSVNVVVVADITISGVAKPEQLIYDEYKTIQEAGPIITHSFLIQNKGPSTVDSSLVSVFLPEKHHGHYILNLLSILVEGNANCKVNQSNLNPLKLEIFQQEQQNSTESLNRRKRGIEQTLNCITGECRILECEIGRLQRGDNVGITLKSMLVDVTFAQTIKKNAIIIVQAEVRPRAVRQPSLHFPDKAAVPVRILASAKQNKSTSKQSVPWWIVLVSALAGLVLIAGIVFVLHMSGFFNRKKRDYAFDAVDTFPKDE